MNMVFIKTQVIKRSLAWLLHIILLIFLMHGSRQGLYFTRNISISNL